ncbi:MAG TPA: L,D-transpeptidase family protein [Xanthobacteraceae bacterium]|nr:L,D-transpeptidase family protein [Xanthobacteraceae bacterium]
MSSRRFDRLLTGTALALALVLAGPAIGAPDGNSAAVEALVPVPDTADVPPPTLADVGDPATGSVTPPPSAAAAAAPAPPAPAATTPAAPIPAATAPTNDGIPPAEPANVPPPTLKDIATAPASPVAEKLRELFAGKIDRMIERKTERKPIETFYAARAFAPLWIENSAANARAKAVIARLQHADADGLDPSDYRVPEFASAADPDALADAEIKLTMAALTYARHAQIGRVHYSRVSADIVYNLVPPEPADVLAKMADAADAGEALGSYNPPHEGYRLLREKLAEARGRNGEGGPARIGSGPVLKVGMQDPRVPLLRERLGVAGDGTAYDKPLAEAVRKFQRSHDLSATGNLNGATVDALNGPRHDRDADVIIANMERWRWLPRDLGKAYVMVNIPDYTLKVVNNGAVAWRTKIVVGKPSMPTPMLSEPMRFITVNPTWNVPPSIIQNEYLPALQQDPTALERIGLKVDYERDGTVHIYQPPGDRNALGRIRFNFPNKFLVYQHDTPDKYLFAHDKRAYSHGCMRVENPLKYAEVLLSIELPKEGYSEERIHRMFGSAEQNINFPTPLPVHITYQTAYVDDAGKLVIREDIYGRDARVLAQLRGEERRFADIAIERHDATRHQAVRVQPPDSGFSFFGRLFR